MLLFGILLCYLMSFVILYPPHVFSCGILRIGIGLCLSICYSAIFIKTNRISRIFNQGVKSIQRPLYTSPISQVAISSGEFIHPVEVLKNAEISINFQQLSQYNLPCQLHGLSTIHQMFVKFIHIHLPPFLPARAPATVS